MLELHLKVVPLGLGLVGLFLSGLQPGLEDHGVLEILDLLLLLNLELGLQRLHFLLHLDHFLF